MVIPEVNSDGIEDLPHWWEKVLKHCNNDRREEVASICWALWKARNELVWQNRYTRTNVMIASAKQYLVQWKNAQINNVGTLVPNLEEGAVVWVKPQMDSIKITVDAATFEEPQASGIGLVARDSNGGLIFARTVCLRSRISAEMAEAIAIKEALSWVKQKNWKQVVIESDCLVVVKAIRSSVPVVSPFGKVIEDFRSMLQDLNIISLLFIKRSANMAAHVLAKMSYSFSDQIFDRTSIPFGVKNVMLVDAS